MFNKQSLRPSVEINLVFRQRSIEFSGLLAKASFLERHDEKWFRSDITILPKKEE